MLISTIEYFQKLKTWNLFLCLIPTHSVTTWKKQMPFSNFFFKVLSISMKSQIRCLSQSRSFSQKLTGIKVLEIFINKFQLMNLLSIKLELLRNKKCSFCQNCSNNANLNLKLNFFYKQISTYKLENVHFCNNWIKNCNISAAKQMSHKSWILYTLMKRESKWTE